MGATENTFYELATANGIRLSHGSGLPWLTNHGHLSDHLKLLDKAAATALKTIYALLGGDEHLLSGKRNGSSPRPDFVISGQGLIIEVDEIQHFTSERKRTLDDYPPGADLAFDSAGYQDLITQHRTVADRYRSDKPAVDFPFAGGRRAQRAYFDALRDLAAPSFGMRVVRVPAPECDGHLAYQRFAAMLSEGRLGGTCRRTR
jgi:hypothetical protein